MDQAQNEVRVRFARDYEDYDVSHVIFCNKGCFNPSQHNRRHLWRVNNTRYKPRNVNPNESGKITVNVGMNKC